MLKSVSMAAAAILAACANLAAQAPPESVPFGTRAVQLPVSGRTGQQVSFQGSVPSAAAPGAPLQLSLDEAVRRAATRKLFGAPLADLQLTQASLAESAVDIDAAALLIYRAAWTKDSGKARITGESASAKMFATEMAQRVIDRAVQLFGGNGVRVGVKVEALYREIRALRIYEGATEVQKLIVAREMLKRHHAKLEVAAQ